MLPQKFYSMVVKALLAHPKKRNIHPIDYLLKDGNILYSGYGWWKNIRTGEVCRRLKIGDIVRYSSIRVSYAGG